MWGRLFRKERQVEQFIFSYLDQVVACRRSFDRAMDVFLREGISDEFHFGVQETHRGESKADDLRYAVEATMYEQAILPEARGDLLGLLENADAIPGALDRLLRIVSTRRMRVPAFMTDDLRRMVTVSLEAVDVFVDQFRDLFLGREDTRAQVRAIDEKERHVDHLERRLMEALFDSPEDAFTKLQGKDLLMELGEISDLAHQMSRRLYILSVKRRV